MTNTHINAITIDLDDTLWPIWPAIRKAEEHLYAWMCKKVPATAAITSVEGLREYRQRAEKAYPQYRHDLSFYRKEAIRMVLQDSAQDQSLADEAFQVFFEQRQHVDFFDDVCPALERLSAHFPIVAVSNGNANLQKIGIDRFFKKSISAQNLGIAKPDPRIYLEAAKYTNTNNPQHILHVGDDFKLDVIGAHQAGFQTAWVIRPELEAQKQPQTPSCKPDYTVNNLLELCDMLGV